MTANLRGLGRGLEALLSSETEENMQINLISITKIIPRADQPRTYFDENALEELTESVKEHGILQPIILRYKGDMYEIVAGERRFKAATRADLQDIPAIVLDIGDRQAAEIAMIENLQRNDLNAWEEARAYKQYMDSFGYTQEQLAARVGKSRSHIANTLRILNLTADVQKMLADQQLTGGHARALIALTEEEQIKTALRIINEKLTVRDAEKISKSRISDKQAQISSVEIIVLQEKLQEHLSAKVKISQRRLGGKIEIDFFDEEDLTRIADIFGVAFE